MFIFKLSDCNISNTVISTLMNNYVRNISMIRGNRILDPRFNTIKIKVRQYEFCIISNLVVNVLNEHDCVLGWVEDEEGRRKGRWWWKSGSCGTWRAGIKFLDNGWASEGIYEDIHGIRFKEKSYIQNIGYLNETQVCHQLQVRMDHIDVARPDFRIWLNEVPLENRLSRSRYVQEIKHLSNTKAFHFLNYIIDNDAVNQYNQTKTTPKYYDITTIDGKSINTGGTFFPIAAIDRGRELLCANLINALEIWSALIVEPMRYLTVKTRPLYIINTDMVKDVQVWQFDVPVVVKGNATLRTLTFEVACSKDVVRNADREIEEEDTEQPDIYGAWLKQCYLHPAPDEDAITSFGNYAYFAGNLVGIIQRSAASAGRTETSDPKPKEVDRSDDEDTAYEKLLDLFLWNEQTSLIVREFKRRVEKSSFYGGDLQNFADGKFDEKEIVECLKRWLHRACDEYLAFHRDQSTWTKYGHSQSGFDRVTAIKDKIDSLNNLNSVDLMFASLIRRRMVDGTPYSGDPCATRQTSFFPIFVFYMSRFALNKLGDMPTIAERIMYWAKAKHDEHKIVKFIVKDLKVVTARNYADVVKAFRKYYI